MNLSMPWAADGDRLYSTPTSLILKLALGEAPERAPAALDVRQRCQQPAQDLDGGPIDRIVARYAGGVRAARLHPSARNCMVPGHRHLGYDDVEQVTGVARTFLLRVPAGTPVGQVCDTLRQITTVEAASPNYVTTLPFDLDPGPVLSAQIDAATAWAPRELIRASQARAVEPGDPAVLLGLIDSGVAPRHSEFPHGFRAGGYDTVRLQPADVAPGIELLGDHADDDLEPNDDFVGHGMACAGIIGATGRKIPPGLAGACRILPMRALGSARLPDKVAPVGLGAIADLDMAMALAVNLGAKVLNLSFGTDDLALDPASPRPHQDTVAYATARGCVLVAASGNNGHTQRYWPAAYPNVIAVSAVDSDGRPTPFTTRGAHVSLSAPGERVLTTSLSGYQYATGTSFAAPFVAATAALLVSRAARRARPLDPTEVKDILVQSARPFAVAEPPSGCGAGILDAAAALRLLDENLGPIAAPPAWADQATYQSPQVSIFKET
jgi:subtilisin family serine protease